MSLATLDRRDLLAGAGALMIAFHLPISRHGVRAQPAAPAPLTAWVRISPDDRVTLILSQAEIGQGISTTLPAILADELGADWAKVDVENAPVAPAYQNPRIRWMFTGNSESIQSYAEVMRKAGAAAREMLIRAALGRWPGATLAECTTADGRVVHRPSGRSLSFGALASDASRLPIPEQAAPRSPTELRLVGRAVPRRDVPGKTDGSAVFGLDFKVAGMVYAAVRQAPVFGGGVASFDPTSVAAMPGVIGAYAIPNGVAVVAEHFWQAKSAADVLDVSFADGPNATFDSAGIESQYRAALDGNSWRVVADVGDAASAVGAAPTKITREYWSPFQAHATMEPMNCTAAVTADGCDVWGPLQGPQMAQIVAAATLQIPADKVRIHWTYSGGGFGRRLLADFVAQAVLLAKTVGRPVKVVWTRQEDMTHDYYRPATLARLSAALGADGAPTAFAARLVSATQLQRVTAGALPENVDPLCTEGLDGARYAFAHHRLDYNKPTLPVPTSVLRTTGFGPNIFALESFIDELAHEAGVDPYRYRRSMLLHDPRALRVLDLAAEKSDRNTPLPSGAGRGLAFYEAFNTVMAQVVELEVDARRTVRLRRIITIADPGKVFDPGIGVSNLEGGVVFGLTSAMKSEITFANGRVEQTNFDGYDMVHLWETAPIVETFLVESGADKIGGLGEVGPVGIPPAFANAVFAATGERVRALPLSRHGYSFALA
ncbi:MAG: xanthine dehydrogenase family protein molybdopterin-binding subunit [Xanthobacteraceae bacterium]|nr:xanthine dehydrogenase family protein molybdopterin-binding subunit [Xanthobacteraceae bacterium]